MKLTASEAQKNLFHLIEQVNKNNKPVLILSEKGNAFLISEREYKSILETDYLFSSPANRRHLIESIAQVERGETSEVRFSITDEGFKFTK